MNALINYKIARSKNSRINQVLFVDDNYSILKLKKFFFKSELSIATDLLKSRNLKKNFVSLAHFLGPSEARSIPTRARPGDVSDRDVPRRRRPQGCIDPDTRIRRVVLVPESRSGPHRPTRVVSLAGHVIETSTRSHRRRRFA